MIINKGLYNYHGVIKSMYHGVDEKTLTKYCVIKAYGKCEVDDRSATGGKKIMKQDMTIFTRSGLALYAEAELDEGDKIMVVGKIVTTQRKKGSVFYYEQCIQAEELYKNDYEKYYGKDV